MGHGAFGRTINCVKLGNCKKACPSKKIIMPQGTKPPCRIIQEMRRDTQTAGSDVHPVWPEPDTESTSSFFSVGNGANGAGNRFRLREMLQRELAVEALETETVEAVGKVSSGRGSLWPQGTSRISGISPTLRTPKAWHERGACWPRLESPCPRTSSIARRVSMTDPRCTRCRMLWCSRSVKSKSWRCCRKQREAIQNAALSLSFRVELQQARSNWRKTHGL